MPYTIADIWNYTSKKENVFLQDKKKSYAAVLVFFRKCLECILIWFWRKKTQPCIRGFRYKEAF